MTYSIIKALHIISVVVWFSGLFYIGRIFIYHAIAREKSEPEKKILSTQYELMEKRVLKIIANPAMFATLFFGFWLLGIHGQFENWLKLKLLFVLGLVIYHMVCGNIRKKLANHSLKLSVKQLRFFNEGATIFLIFIVCLAVLKSQLIP
ncbi:MAG: CopD family protein [Candidatus Margulisbacteria bacterium]|nr:CopD family protein [Candidatus Margulisiibacteriota bacterium]